jgi:hypothetical protein
MLTTPNPKSHKSNVKNWLSLKILSRFQECNDLLVHRCITILSFAIHESIRADRNDSDLIPFFIYCPFNQNRVQTQIIFARQQSIFSKQSSDPDYICKTTVHFLKTEFRPRLYLQDNSPFTQNRVQTQIIFVRQQSIFSKQSWDPDYICKTTVHLLKTEFRPRLYL